MKIQTLDRKPTSWKQALAELRRLNPRVDVGDLAIYADRTWPGLRNTSGMDQAGMRAAEVAVELAKFAKEKGISVDEAIDLYKTSLLQKGGAARV